MALTLRMNGSTPSSLVSSSWWNDYYSLLTGSMLDQPVTFGTNLTMVGQSVVPPNTSLLAVPQAFTGMSVGVYQYAITYVQADGGETLPSSTVSCTTTSTNASVEVENIPLGPSGTVKRNIYRTKVNGSSLFKLVSIADNTTIFFFDNSPDTSLVTSAPVHNTFSGAIFMKDGSGNTNLTISADGALFGSGGAVSFGATTVSNLTISGGKIGKTVSADIIDAGGDSTFIKARNAGNILLQVPNGTTVATHTSSALTLTGNLFAQTIHAANGFSLDGGSLNLGSNATLNATNLTIVGTGMLFGSSPQLNAPLLLQPGNTASPSSIVSGTAGFGVKMNNGTKLFEAKANGSFVISGSTFFNTTGVTSTGGTFDSFDMGESFAVDQEYPAGTVLCPSDLVTPIPYTGANELFLPQLAKCTHDKCSLAVIAVAHPGFCSGTPNLPSEPWYDNTQALAQPCCMVGRVFANTLQNLVGKVYVCSDGQGNVRQMLPGESGMSLGITLAPTVSGMVPVFVRSTFVTL